MKCFYNTLIGLMVGRHLIIIVSLPSKSNLIGKLRLGKIKDSSKATWPLRGRAESDPLV